MTSKVEGREYTPSAKPAAPPKPTVESATTSRSETPSNAALGSDPRKAKVDDKYFAKLGADNAARPAGLPPSQGGKYAGFGSAGPEPPSSEQKLPGFDDLQKDPMAALTKGFGWFTTTVGKTAKTVNEGYIQPTAQRVCLQIYLQGKFG